MLIPFKTYKVEFKAGGFTPESIKLIKKHKIIQNGVIDVMDKLLQGVPHCSCGHCSNIDAISDECSIVMLLKPGLKSLSIDTKAKHKARDVMIMGNELLMILHGDIISETIDAILNGEIGE